MNTEVENNDVVSTTGNVIPDNHEVEASAKEEATNEASPAAKEAEIGGDTADFSDYEEEAARDSDLDLGLSEETTAAIESIVERLDVGDLQDDVDLGLDVIDTMSDQMSDPREGSISPREDIPSPHDIEIDPNHEELPEPEVATSLPRFSRVPILRLARVRIGPDCFRQSGRVDLKAFALASPEFYKVGKPKSKGSKKEFPPQPPQPKSSVTPVKKKEPKIKKVPVENVKKVNIVSSLSKAASSASSDSDSDSDLEELRKKIMKPKLFEKKVDADLVKEAKANLTKKKEVKKDATKHASKDVIKKSNATPSAKPRPNKLFKPCQIKVERLSQKQIDRWISRPKQRVRSISSSDSRKQRARSMSSNDSRSKFKTKGIISSSDDDSSDDDDKVPEPAKKMVANPLFGFNPGKSEEEVKQVLVERLFSLLSDDKEKSPAKDTLTKDSPAKPIVADEPVKPVDPEPKARNVKVEEAKVDPKELAKKERDKDLTVIYANNKESVDVKAIAELRPFADLLKIEMSTGSLGFLGNYRITLKELETIVHKVIKKLETPRPLEKPSEKLPGPSAYEKVKYKIKDCSVQVKDMKKDKIFQKATDAYIADMPRRVRKRRGKLMGYLRVISEHRKNENHHKRKFAIDSDDSDTDDKRPSQKSQHKKARVEENSHFGSFKIPKKDGKDDKPKIHSGSSLQKPSSSSSNQDSKSGGYSNSYNHSYNKKPNPKDGQSRQANAKPKKSFEEALFKATEPKKFNVLDVMSSMKNLNNKPKEDHFSAKKSKEGENKPPMAVQDSNRHHPHARPARTPTPENEAEKDPELDRLLSKWVRNRQGREFRALVVRIEDGLQVFKCQICRVQIDGKPNLMQHLSGQRHAKNKSYFQDVHQGHHQHNRQQHQQSHRQRSPPRSNHRSHDRHERVEAPWTFSPSEVVDDVPHHDDNASDEYRPNSPMDFGGDDHYDPPSPAGNVPSVPSLPPASTSLPTLSLPTPVPALPKPVPSIQPTQVLNPNAFGIGPSHVPNPALFQNSLNSTPVIPGLDFAMAQDHPPMMHHFDAPMPVQREPSIDEDNLFPDPPIKIPEHQQMDDDMPSPAVSPVPAPLPDPDFIPSPIAFTDFPPMPVPPPVQQVPSPVPAPVPAPAKSYSPTPVPAPSKSLTLKDLKKLPKSMSFEDRVIRGLESQKNADWQRAREAREKVKNTNDDDEAYVPPGLSSDEEEEYVPAGLETSPMQTGDKTPVYESTTDKPAVSSPVIPMVNEFNIDPTKSFFDQPKKIGGGIKVRSMGSLMAKPEDDLKPKNNLPKKHILNLEEKEAKEKPPEKTAPKKPEKPAKKPKLGSFFDKVIKSLQKQSGGPSMQLPSMNMNEDDTNPGQATDYQPPLPPMPNLPPPPMPAQPSSKPEGFDPGSILDDDILDIVSELDKDMAEEEKLAKAKEKLAQILQKKMNQNQASPAPQPALPPMPKAGPRSKMQVQPEVAYRAGPRSRLQSLNPTLLAAAPPPPPPEDPGHAPIGVPTDDEISNFMSQWTRPEHEHEGQVEQASAPVEQPQYSSALAKLRAKKAAKNANKKPVPLMQVNTDHMALDQAPYFEFDQNNSVNENFNKNRAAEIEGRFSSRSLESWKRIHQRRWDDLMKDMFAELWEKQKALSKRKDIGAVFGDPTLNENYVEAESGEIKPLYTYKEDKGNIFIKCEICNLTALGKTNLDTHIAGKKHRTNLKKFEMSASDISPPGEDLLPHEPVIYRLFDKFKEAPLIGIEYIVEIIHGANVDPSYECLLCCKSLDSKDVISCLISAKHRLKYLEKFYPIARAKFAQVPNMDLWERATYDFLESVAMRIEEKHGRLSVTNITKADYDSNKEFILNRIEDGPHFRQSNEQDFTNLPDPFGSYRNKLSYKDFGPPPSIDPQSLGHIEDPQMQSLMQREISRFRDKATLPTAKSVMKEDTPESAAATISKDAVLNKEVVAETSKDDKAVVMAKLADLRSNLSKEEREEYEKYRQAPDKIQDDDIKVLESSSESTSKKGKQLPHRKLVMGRKPAAGNAFYDKKNTPPPRRENYEQNRGYNREFRDRGRERDYDRGRDYDREREYDRERGGRDRERESRRSRSRSRSRSRERRGSKKRSNSPFSVAYENWRKFRQAEKVMYDGVHRKKDIYDKRPEDHPQYPEEWRIFWEKRYKEIQSQGKDADNYDYKPDWIPYWAKKSHELYKNEIHVKTQDLLKKFDLKSADEPLREDFEHLNRPPIEPMRGREDERYGGRNNRRHDQRDRSRSRSRERDHRGSYRHDSHRRSFSPPRWESHGRSRSPGFDSYSGITDLENIRDHGKSPDRYSRDRNFAGLEPPQIVETLRHVTALEHLLGSLAPQITAMMSRALTLENKRKNTSNLMLEDSNAAGILELTKEKLAGQIVAGLVTPAQETAVKGCIDKLERILTCATKKRPDGPPSVLSDVDPKTTEREKLKSFFAKTLATQMVQRGMANLTEYELHKLVYAIAVKTSLDDGNLAEPPKYPPAPSPPPPHHSYGYYGQGYATGPSTSAMMGNRGMYNAQPPQHAPPKPGPPSSISSNSAAYATPIYNKESSQPPLSKPERPPADQPPPAKKAKESEDDNLDEFDDLTVDELRSLLDNFKNLSKGEQMDLIRYMRKLEQNDPQKVKLLKQSVKPGGQAKTGNPSAVPPPQSSQTTSAPREVKSEPNRERPISQASSNHSGSQGFRGMVGGPPPPPPPEESNGPPPNWGQPPPPNNSGPPPDTWGGGPMGSNNGGPWGPPPGRWNNAGPPSYGGYGQQDGYYGPNGGHGGYY